eukprot:332644-Amorphochlora_amoeboformis.AAC.2
MAGGSLGLSTDPRWLPTLGLCVWHPSDLDIPKYSPIWLPFPAFSPVVLRVNILTKRVVTRVHPHAVNKNPIFSSFELRYGGGGPLPFKVIHVFADRCEAIGFETVWISWDSWVGSVPQ